MHLLNGSYERRCIRYSDIHIVISNLCSNSPFNVPSSYMVKMIDKAILLMEGFTAPVFPKKKYRTDKIIFTLQ